MKARTAGLRVSTNGIHPMRHRNLGAALGRRDQFLLLVVPLTIFGVFFALPNLLNFPLSLTNWNSRSDEISFVGLDNFVRLAANGELWNSMRVTITFALLVAVFQNVTGLLLALGLERPTRANTILRAVFFIPVLISPLAAGYIFRGLLAYGGPLDQAASALAGVEVHIPWFTSETWTIVVVAAVHAWKFFGITMLVYIAGLAAIPEELTQAAKIDGAGRWKAFWLVRWPLLAPALTINLTLTIIGTLGAFDVILATTSGGPVASTKVFNMFLYEQYGNGLFGSAITMGLVLFVTVIVIAVPLVSYLRRREIDA